MSKEKGKCFSACNRGQRKESDFYETPYSMTQQLLNEVRILINSQGTFLEPCCGNGAIVKELDLMGYKNIVHYDKYVGCEKADFLVEERGFNYLITNPPYSLAKKFIIKASSIIQNFFWLLLPLSYLHGKERYDLFYSKGLLNSVYIFTRYPMLGEALRGDGKYHTGMIAYAWFEFLGTKYQYKFKEPKIYWLDNQKYILSKKDKENA